MIRLWLIGVSLVEAFRVNLPVRFAEHRRRRHTIAEAKKRAWR